MAVLLLATFCVPATALAQRSRPALSVRLLAEGERPTIDGRIDEALWTQALPYSEFIQQEPFEGRPATDVGWSRDDVRLPTGDFRNDLVPVRVSYAFTRLASVQALIQYNRQASTLSGNLRLALLSRSGTGFFVVFNDRRDTSSVTPDEVLGRSVVLKFTRLFTY